MQTTTIAELAEPALLGSIVEAGSAFERDRFLLKQRRLSLTEKYAISDDQGQQILFVRREAHHLRQLAAFGGAFLAGGVVGTALIAPMTMILNSHQHEDLLLVLIIVSIAVAIVAMIAVGLWLFPKRHIGFFTDLTMQHQMLTVLQDKKFAFVNATYTIADPEFNLLGWCRKNYLYNIIRKRWYVYGPSGELMCVAIEDSIWKSILRRIAREYLPLMRTNFIFLAPDMKTKLGEFNRRFTLFDQYVLDLTSDAERRLDRRLAVALGVLLDTGERR